VGDLRSRSSSNGLPASEDGYLVCLVCLVEPDEPNQPDKQNKPDQPDGPEDVNVTVFRQVLRKFSFALDGCKAAVRSEQSVRIQLAVSAAVVLAGGLLGLTQLEWLFVIASIGVVISLELLNTAIEKMLDLLHPAKHDSVKFIKDVSAAAVLISSLAAVIVGLIIFSHHFF